MSSDSESDSPTPKRLKPFGSSSMHSLGSTSASSVQKRFQYDVFLSFRGIDTRRTFFDHLYHALSKKGVITYKGDEKIDKGERINEQLIRSIEDSRFYIIVFSKNYASSSWCLDELVKIMECQRTAEQTAYPVFYDVEPTEVRNQSGAVGEAFAKLEENEDAGRWRDALKEAASLVGWELKNTFDGHEAKFIKYIVQEISLKPHFINSSIDAKLVGMETRVKDIVSSLEVDFDNDVRMIGIKGMGGGGKTTLATAVYDYMSYYNWFDGISFVENVIERSKGSRGLENLQKQILSDVLNDQSIVIRSTHYGKNIMRKMMPRTKVLLILDDVDDIEQLDALAGEPTWFKAGSRIIITTRDEQVLLAHGVHSDNIHDVSLFSHEEAICLFSRCALNREVPTQEYAELSRKVVSYANGVPLNITVLGSLLCGGDVCEWEDAIKRLETIREDETIKRLELSYDALQNDHREIDPDVNSEDVCIVGNFNPSSIHTMASTSASKVQRSYKYDVFLSFRGEDTRKNFVDHLYLALVKRGILTYKDNEEIEKGEKINEQLLKSIKESRFYIIVFSKNYASSSWCLNELLKIMECQRTDEHTAYPVFYDVEPTEVRNQTGPFEDAFAKHIGKEDEGRWRDALKEAADLAAWVLSTTSDGHEGRFIQELVKEISLQPHFSIPSVDGELVGIKSRVEHVVSSLAIGDVRMIGIKGIGGGGKTTLARAVYDYMSSYMFDGKSFVENVRERSKGSRGLEKLQKQILSAVFNDKSIVVDGVFDGKNMMKRIMGSRKVLIVLDDVDDTEQLKALAGESSWFGSGSRIIITTRDEQVLVAHGVHGDNIRDVNLLSDEEAIRLFSRCALNREVPTQEYAELSRKFVSYAHGLPLTITILGKHLCCKDVREWEDAIKRLETIPDGKTLKTLEISYDGLENDQKEMFLDVACMLRGENKDDAIRILESLGLNARYGLGVLEQKSLMTVSDDCNCIIDLHDRIEEMGRDIVRRLHPEDPNKHTRLWIKEEIEDILVKELGTEETLSIKLKVTNLHPAEIMKGLEKMKKLKFLCVNNGDRVWYNDDANPYLPNSLRYLNWPRYPFWCLPITFGASKLVNLEMVASNISQLWEGENRKVLDKLRFLNLGYSKNLRTFNIGLTPVLERLDLNNCELLVELNTPHKCPKLQFLNLSGSKVSSFNLWHTPNLESLNLRGCKDFVELNMPLCPNLKFLYLSDSKVSSFNLGLTPHIVELDLSGSKVSSLNLEITPHIEGLFLARCKDFVQLTMPHECPKLKVLDLSYSKLINLKLGLTPNLERLDLGGCDDFVELNMPNECPKLKVLDLSYSKLINLKLGIAPNLERLDLGGCDDFVDLNMAHECPKLKFLDLSYSKLISLKLGLTPHIERLYLKGCKKFVELKMPNVCPKLKFLNLSESKVGSLNLGVTPHVEKLHLSDCEDFVKLNMPHECPKLTYLNLSGSKISSLNLRLTPYIKHLDLEGCYYLQEIHSPVGCLKELVYLNLSGCLRFEGFLFESGYYRRVPYDNFKSTLELTAKSLDICQMHPDSNLPKFQFKCIYKEYLPSQSGNVERLISFGLCSCTNLESFSAAICGLQHLRMLTLEGSIPEAPKELGHIESLEGLILSMEDIKRLPDSICMLKHLKFLHLKSCWLLEQLPKDLGRLECLVKLFITNCGALRDIPDSICNMKSLENLDLCNCTLVEKLPEELGRLKCLKTLSIECAGVSHLPRSIFQLKGLLVIGSRWQLESNGFTSSRKTGITRDMTDFCYIT